MFSQGSKIEILESKLDMYEDLSREMLSKLENAVDKISEGISKDVAREYAKSLGLELFNGNDLVNLPEYVLGKNTDGTDLYESPQEAVTEEIW